MWLFVFAAETTAAQPDVVPLTRLYATSWGVGEYDQYGKIPAGWTDRIALRPSRNWIVDAGGFLRPTLKRTTGLITYDGYLGTAKPARVLADLCISALFKKTPDAEESFGIAARVQDKDNYYLARFVGDDLLQLIVVAEGEETVLSQTVSLDRYRDGDIFHLLFLARGETLTAYLRNPAGQDVARVDGVDSRFAKGPPGLRCTPYAGASSFTIYNDEEIKPDYDTPKIVKRNERLRAGELRYAVVRPDWRHDERNTRPERTADDYDVIVAGAGTGGFGTAVQAARLGARVLLIDETDWIGGQAAAAAVTSMDEDGVYGKYPVRERGLYREFHESMVAH
jgi:hypothetical protein